MLCKNCGWEGNTWRCKPCKKKQDTAYRVRNRAKIRNRQIRFLKDWRERDREGYNLYRRKYRKKSLYDKIYRERVLWLLQGTVTRNDLCTIYEKANGCCVYCKKTVKASFNPIHCRGFDHVRPKVRGGKHEKNNIVVCCRTCNELKGDKDVAIPSIRITY